MKSDQVSPSQHRNYDCSIYVVLAGRRFVAHPQFISDDTLTLGTRQAARALRFHFERQV